MSGGVQPAPQKSSRFLGNLIMLGVMVGILALDQFVFRRVFGLSHWRWYLENGVEIGFVTTAVSLVWEEMLESSTTLISAEPAVYYAANFHFMGVCIQTLGVQMQGEPGKPCTIPFYEVLFGLPLMVALAALLFAWLLVVAPAQYFLYLVCGSPARVLAQAPYQLVLWFEHGRLHTEKIPRDAPIPEGRVATSFAKKPVAVTNLFVSLTLLIVRHFMGGS